MQEAIMLPALVITLAQIRSTEATTRQETGVTADGWMRMHDQLVGSLLGSGRFPVLAALQDPPVRDLDALFEYGLARHLDGLAVYASRSPAD